jgi:hypothetical protein
LLADLILEIDCITMAADVGATFINRDV